MNKNIYMMVDGEIMETFKNVSEVSYKNKTLSFYIEETDYNFDEVQAEIVYAPDGLTITKDNYKDYLLENENAISENEKINNLESKIEDLTKLIEAMSLNTK